MLGVVVLADLFVIVLFALCSAAAKAALGIAGGARIAVGHIAWELLGSIVAGFVLAAALAAYLRWVRRGSTLFVLTAAFVVAEVGQRIGSTRLVSLTAGVLVRNLTALGDELHERVGARRCRCTSSSSRSPARSCTSPPCRPSRSPCSRSSRSARPRSSPPGRAGARLAGAPPEVARWAPYRLLPQAGVALALALLFTRAFPEFGSEASAVALGVVAMNEIVAPAVYRLALLRSGEAGRAHAHPTPAPASPAPRAIGHG